MGKKQVVKSLTDIQTLFVKDASGNNETKGILGNKTFKVTKPTTVVLDEDDTISIMLWKISQDYRPRTMFSLLNRLSSIVSQQSWYNDEKINTLSVESMVLKMHQNGQFIRTTIDKTTTYVLNKEATMPTTPQNKTVAIEKTDSIDMAIWKLFSNYKPWDLFSAAAELAKYGFARSKVKDRITTLARRDWFTRNDAGKVLKYVLKKTTKAPMDASTPATLATYLTTIKEPKFVAPTVGSEKTNELPKQPALPFNSDSEIISSVVTHDIPVFNKNPIECVKPTNEVSVEDKVDRAIWKVFSDYKSYSVADVCILLEDYLQQRSIAKKTIGIRISDLFINKNWFTKERVGKTFIYTLQKHIEIPENNSVKKYADTEPEKAKTESTESKEALAAPENVAPITEKSVEEMRDMMNTNPLKCVEIFFKLNGSVYTVDEMKKISEAVKALQTTAASSNELFQIRQQFVLSGKALSDEEIDNLRFDLVELGFI